MPKTPSPRKGFDLLLLARAKRHVGSGIESASEKAESWSKREEPLPEALLGLPEIGRLVREDDPYAPRRGWEPTNVMTAK